MANRMFFLRRNGAKNIRPKIPQNSSRARNFVADRGIWGEFTDPRASRSFYKKSIIVMVQRRLSLDPRGTTVKNYNNF